MSEVWTKTELKAADNVLMAIDGFPPPAQDAILAIVQVLLTQQRAEDHQAMLREKV